MKCASPSQASFELLFLWRLGADRRQPPQRLSCFDNALPLRLDCVVPDLRPQKPDAKVEAPRAPLVHADYRARAGHAFSPTIAWPNSGTISSLSATRIHPEVV
jgi:hypothetical protein